MVIRSIIAGGVLVNLDRAARLESGGACVRSMPVLDSLGVLHSLKDALCTG